MPRYPHCPPSAAGAVSGSVRVKAGSVQGWGGPPPATCASPPLRSAPPPCSPHVAADPVTTGRSENAAHRDACPALSSPVFTQFIEQQQRFNRTVAEASSSLSPARGSEVWSLPSSATPPEPEPEPGLGSSIPPQWPFSCVISFGNEQGKTAGRLLDYSSFLTFEGSINIVFQMEMLPELSLSKVGLRD